MKTRKELKEAYKQMAFKMGVYQIRNLQTNRVFIGSSLNIDAIGNRHRTQLNFGTHRNRELQNDWNILGAEQFNFETIELLETDEGDQQIIARELKTLLALKLEEMNHLVETTYNQK